MESVVLAFPDETSHAGSSDCATCGQNNQWCECVTCDQNNQAAVLTNAAPQGSSELLHVRSEQSAANEPCDGDTINVIAKSQPPRSPRWERTKQFNECRSSSQKLIYFVSCCNLHTEFGCDAPGYCYICGEDHQKLMECCFSINCCVNGSCLCCIPCFICCASEYSSCVHENSILICPGTYLY